MKRNQALLLLAAFCSSLTTSAVAISSSAFSVNAWKQNSDEEMAIRLRVRGGSSESPKKKSKKRSKKSGKAKKAISDAMKEKDAAKALGDAIRDRADDLRKEDPFLQSIDGSINSLGYAMGASDHRMSEGGGVETATTSVVANYFLKSHGGAHGLQFLCSFLATVSGIGVLLLGQKKPQLGFVLLQRTLIFAMIKHVSGVLAAASIAAKAVPKIGLTHARQWMEQLVLDPVSQYVFYTAVVLLWLPSKSRLEFCWWWKKSFIPILLASPVLLREIISNIMVFSDILVLWSVGSESSAIESILKVSNSIIDAMMSLLLSAKAWKSADASGRQAIMAKLVSQVSLGSEVGVGLLMLVDILWSLLTTAFGSSANRPPFKETIIKLMCVRLYVHFLWVRKSKISKLAMHVRGGASKVPFWFFDILDHPVQSMGLELETIKNDSTHWTWREYATIALGLDQ